MARDSEDNLVIIAVLRLLEKELKELLAFKNLYFENHPLESAGAKKFHVEAKKNVVLESFDNINVYTQIPVNLQHQFFYYKGCCYNVSATYDDRATQCLTQAVKLNPRFVDAWNELGECYLKCMNFKEAKASFKAALNEQRNSPSLRALSTILLQQSTGKEEAVATAYVLQSVQLAKEAAAIDLKDGLSWIALGNALLWKFFFVDHEPVLVQMCLTSYMLADLDPVARGNPELFYNRGFALKYEERYDEALDNFDHASRLDPHWESPQIELKTLSEYLTSVNDLVKTRGKIGAKKLMQMVQSIDKKMLGEYGPFKVQTFGERYNVFLEYARIDELQEGTNEEVVILGKVVGSIQSDTSFPFTFAMVDESMKCVCVTVYNLAPEFYPKIGDCVTIPEPKTFSHLLDSPLLKYDFKSIRVDSPCLLLVNGYEFYPCPYPELTTYEAYAAKLASGNTTVES